MRKPQLYIIPMTYCNYNCKFCFLQDFLKNDARCYPTEEDIYKIFTEFLVDEIILHGGELSLDQENLLQFLTTFYKIKIKTNSSAKLYLTTNGSILLSHKICKILDDLGGIIVSYYPWNKQFKNTIRYYTERIKIIKSFIQVDFFTKELGKFLEKYSVSYEICPIYISGKNFSCSSFEKEEKVEVDKADYECKDNIYFFQGKFILWEEFTSLINCTHVSYIKQESLIKNIESLTC